MKSQENIGNRTYVTVWVILLALLALTTVLARVNLGFLNVPLALAIAASKTTLVILYFMHVRYSARLVQLFVSAGFFWFFLLMILVLGDYWTR
jgi:cytochrome c oxidase subunit IV